MGYKIRKRYGGEATSGEGRYQIQRSLGRSYGDSFAAESRNEGAMELLLERGNVNPGLPNHDGRTPLSLPLLRGHRNIIKLPLDSRDVNSNFIGVG